MESSKISFNELFEQVIELPDSEYHSRLAMLVGIDEAKERLSKILGVLTNLDGIQQWAKKYHPDADRIIKTVTLRPPLVILAGDVGTGKTELASTIGDAVARQEKIQISLFSLSLSTRGNGMVGQMTKLISSAFEYTLEKAKKVKSESGKHRGAVILLVDEADALVQSRENNQMHHEDKAGVNAFIRGIDGLGHGRLPVAVILCTNRFQAIDPAIKRRAAEIIHFIRPTEDQRLNVLNLPLAELGIPESIIREITKLTGPQKGTVYGFTFSDLTQRLLPSIILDAYPNGPVIPKRALEITKSIIPTPPFKDS